MRARIEESRKANGTPPVCNEKAIDARLLYLPNVVRFVVFFTQYREPITMLAVLESSYSCS